MVRHGQKHHAHVADAYQNAMEHGITIEGPRPSITGFPGPHKLTFAGKVKGEQGTLILPHITATGFPIPGQTVSVLLPEGFELHMPGLTKENFLLPDYMELEGPIPKQLPASFSRDDLRDWRDQGGRIDITAFDIRRQPLSVTGTAALTLGQDLQPAADVPATIRGHMAFLSMLREKNIIDDKAMLVAGAVLGGLTQENEETGIRYIQAPLQLRNSTLLLGPLEILTFPDIIWPYKGPAPRQPYTTR